jgi:hypothetical protein
MLPQEIYVCSLVQGLEEKNWPPYSAHTKNTLVLLAKNGEYVFKGPKNNLHPQKKTVFRKF